MFICNREHYGFLPMPLKPQQSLQEEAENFVHTLIEAMSELLCPCHDGPPPSECLQSSPARGPALILLEVCILTCPL